MEVSTSPGCCVSSSPAEARAKADNNAGSIFVRAVHLLSSKRFSKVEIVAEIVSSLLPRITASFRTWPRASPQ